MKAIYPGSFDPVTNGQDILLQMGRTVLMTKNMYILQKVDMFIIEV